MVVEQWLCRARAGRTCRSPRMSKVKRAYAHDSVSHTDTDTPNPDSER